jgi:hypothetical protein
VRWYPSCIPSDRVPTLCPVMYTATLVCSDPACAEEFAGEAATLHELETLLCDCGCALQIVGWPEVEAEPLAQVIMLRVGSGRLAA